MLEKASFRTGTPSVRREVVAPSVVIVIIEHRIDSVVQLTLALQ